MAAAATVASQLPHFAGLRRAGPAKTEPFSHAAVHFRLDQSRRASRAVVAMAGSGKVFLFVCCLLSFYLICFLVNYLIFSSSLYLPLFLLQFFVGGNWKCVSTLLSSFCYVFII